MLVVADVGRACFWLVMAWLCLAGPVLAEVEVTGRIVNRSPVHGEVVFQARDSSCGPAAADPFEVVTRSDREGRYAAGLPHASSPVMSILLPGGRTVSRQLEPVLYDRRLPPAELPSLRTRTIRLANEAGEGVEGATVESPGGSLPYGYTLEPWSCTTGPGGICRMVLAGFETKDLTVPAQGAPGVESEGATLTLRLGSSGPDGRPAGSQPEESAVHVKPRRIHIVDEAGVPVTNAVIWRADDPSCFGRSGDSGSVTIEMPHEASAIPWLVGGTDHELRLLTPGEADAGGGSILLRRTNQSIGARIVDPDLRPISDVKVSLSSLPLVTYSDDDGLALFHGLATPLREAVALDKTGFSPSTIEAQPREPALTRNVRWKMYPTSSAYGFAGKEGDWDYGDMIVTLGGHLEIRTGVGADGRFLLPEIPRGPQILQLWYRDQLVHMAELFAQDSGGHINMGHLSIGETVSLWGDVLDQDDRPVADARVLVDLGFDPARDRPEPLLPDGKAYDPILATTQDAGGFTIEGVPAHSTVSLAAWKDGYATAPRLVSTDEATDAIRLRLYRLVPVDLRIVSQLDLEPIADATVFLFPGVPSTAPTTSQRLDFDHQRVLQTDRSGVLTALVFPGGHGSFEIFADGFLGKTDSLVFPEYEDETVTIELTPEARLSGLLLGPDGKPIAGATVQLDGVLTGVAPPHALTGADGTFRLESLPPGEVRLVARARGYSVERRDVFLSPGPNPEVEWVLSAQERYRVAGRVVSASGDPFSRLHLQAFDAASAQIYPTKTDDEGYFEFDALPASTYTFAALGEPVTIVAEPFELSSDALEFELVGIQAEETGSDSESPF